MRAFVTGGTGFIGSHLVRKLRARGDEVVALVRSPEKAADIREQGCELVQGGLENVDAIRRGLDGCDACFHGAAIYTVGIPKSAHEQMYETNVRGTERVLDAAIEAGTSRIVYLSTIAVFGNTHGQVLDESKYDGSRSEFTSYYDETKYLAHKAALDRIEKGAPIVIVQPGGVYGPNDHSEVGDMMMRAAKGRLPAFPFGETGFNMVHVEDAADGIILAYEKGEVGESYVLGGELTDMRTLLKKSAEVAGKKPPRREIPAGVMKAIAPMAPVTSRVLGTPQNIREAMAASKDVTYWAKDDKAREDLGYEPRDLDTGLRETLRAS